MLPRALVSLQSILLTHLLASCILFSTWSSQPWRWAVRASELSADVGYAPEFAYLGRSIIGRQDQQNGELKNNEKKEMDIIPGKTTHFVLKQGQRRVVRAEGDIPDALVARDTGSTTSEEDIDNVAELQKRQAGSVWITANTCRQPSSTKNDTRSARNQPQLVMYVSSQNQKPGPDSTQNLLTDPTGLLFDSGYASFTAQSNSDVYIGISAPNLDKDWFGSWHFEVVASTDGPYHSYNDSDPFLFMIDTDSESALFITYNLSDSTSPDTTDKWKENNPFRMYAFPAGAGSPITGVEHSFCAIKELFNTTNNLTVATSITNKFGAGLPKSQFHVQGLENGKVYNGFLVVDGNQTETVQLPGVGQVRGGGKVFQQFNWTTKVEDSCQVLFDLDFCDTVAYAVPSSPGFKFDDSALKKLYDDKAKAYYTNFTNSLAQVACDTSSDAQYSLARTCKDCERDYKNWLCSVLIPRCEDWSPDDDFLQQRNINAPFANGTSLTLDETMRDRFGYNRSRNPLIDDTIKPGPYKEMLPCEDLCFDIVRSCPAQLGFACPNSPARELTYGKRALDQNSLTCNFPGAVVRLNFQGAAGTLSAHVHLAVLVSVIATATILI